MLQALERSLTFIQTCTKSLGHKNLHKGMNYWDLLPKNAAALGLFKGDIAHTTGLINKLGKHPEMIGELSAKDIATLMGALKHTILPMLANESNKPEDIAHCLINTASLNLEPLYLGALGWHPINDPIAFQVESMQATGAKNFNQGLLLAKRALMQWQATQTISTLTLTKPGTSGRNRIIQGYVALALRYALPIDLNALDANTTPPPDLSSIKGYLPASDLNSATKAALLAYHTLKKHLPDNWAPHIPLSLSEQALLDRARALATSECEKRFTKSDGKRITNVLAGKRHWATPACLEIQQALQAGADFIHEHQATMEDFLSYLETSMHNFALSKPTTKLCHIKRIKAKSVKQDEKIELSISKDFLIHLTNTTVFEQPMVANLLELALQSGDNWLNRLEGGKESTSPKRGKQAKALCDLLKHSASLLQKTLSSMLERQKDSHLSMQTLSKALQEKETWDAFKKHLPATIGLLQQDQEALHSIASIFALMEQKPTLQQWTLDLIAANTTSLSKEAQKNLQNCSKHLLSHPKTKTLLPALVDLFCHEKSQTLVKHWANNKPLSLNHGFQQVEGIVQTAPTQQLLLGISSILLDKGTEHTQSTLNILWHALIPQSIKKLPIEIQTQAYGALKQTMTYLQTICANQAQLTLEDIAKSALYSSDLAELFNTLFMSATRSTQPKTPEDQHLAALGKTIAATLKNLKPDPMPPLLISSIIKRHPGIVRTLTVPLSKDPKLSAFKRSLADALLSANDLFQALFVQDKKGQQAFCALVLKKAPLEKTLLMKQRRGFLRLIRKTLKAFRHLPKEHVTTLLDRLLNTYNLPTIKPEQKTAIRDLVTTWHRHTFALQTLVFLLTPTLISTLSCDFSKGLDGRKLFSTILGMANVAAFSLIILPLILVISPSIYKTIKTVRKGQQRLGTQIKETSDFKASKVSSDSKATPLKVTPSNNNPVKANTEDMPTPK